jgi:CheY-like chemotaxis protein
MKIGSISSRDNILKDRSVLELDDEESLRMLLEEGLSVQGLRVDCAATPAEALALISRRRYDIFLCDLNLTAAGQPADGRQVTKQILAAAGANQPAVIFMTGELVDTREPGSSEPRRLQKPFRISDVVTLLREMLAASSAVPAEKIRK